MRRRTVLENYECAQRAMSKGPFFNDSSYDFKQALAHEHFLLWTKMASIEEQKESLVRAGILTNEGELESAYRKPLTRAQRSKRKKGLIKPVECEICCGDGKKIWMHGAKSMCVACDGVGFVEMLRIKRTADDYTSGYVQGEVEARISKLIPADPSNVTERELSRLIARIEKLERGLIRIRNYDPYDRLDENIAKAIARETLEE